MIQEPIQQDEQIEDVQDDDDGKPVSSDYLGTIKTIEEIMDVIGNVLNYVEIVGRDLAKTEITAFQWIKRAYNMPCFDAQSRRLTGKQADKFLELTSEFEALISPCDAENPQHVAPMDDRIKEENKKNKAFKPRMKSIRKAEEWEKKKATEQPKPQPERVADPEPEPETVTLSPAKVKQEVFFSACMN